MITSFRVRLTLLSMLLSGLALAAFGFGTWWQIHRMRIARLDNDVRTHAERESGRRRDPMGWQRTAANMAMELGLRDGNDLLVLVADADGKTVYCSPGWPGSLDANALSWPKRQDGRTSSGSGRNAGPEPPPRPRNAGPDRPPDGPPPEPGPPGPPPASVSMSQKIAGRLWRLGLASTSDSRVAVAVNEASIDAEMRGIRNALLVAMPLALVLIGVGGWAFSGRALRPVKELTAATRRVTAAGLDQRISVHGEDREFVELIDVFNGMLERLERSFRQAYRFSTDAAHELKTPLAILQGQLEHAIHSAEEGSPMQTELAGILDEVTRLSTISRKLLLLAQADAGRLNLHREPFDLSKALADLVEDTRMLAPHLNVTSEIQPGLSVPADGALLTQVLHNLVSNAIKYNVQRGWIRISAGALSHQVEVVVANASTGIPSSGRDKVFDRFYRADTAHSRHVDGVGLGLSVSREIARAHGGDITLETDSDGTVQFALVLPATAHQSATST